MQLLLMRHGEALPMCPEISTDAERPLSLQGRRDVSAAAAGLKTLGKPLDIILASPLRRAMESAKRVAEVFPDTRIIPSPFLRPNGAVIDLQNALASFLHLNNVLLIGHNPDIAMTICVLSRDPRYMAVSPACIAAFDWVPQKTAQMLWIRSALNWPKP
jgi:phosphohistidine phosphatase SixA